MRYEILHEESQFLALKTVWTQLLIRSNSYNPFLTWEWMYTWWLCYKSNLTAPQIQIICIYDQSKIVAIIPLYRFVRKVAGLEIRSLRILGDQFESTDYVDIIFLPEYKNELSEIIIELLTDFSEKFDELDFKGLLSDSFLYDRLESNEKFQGYAETYKICPFITLPADFESFLQTLNNKFRYNFRRRDRQLKKDYNYTFEADNQIVDVESDLNDFFDLHLERKNSIGKKTKFRPEARKAFHLNLLKQLLPQKRAQFLYLKSGERKIAGLYVYSDQHFLYFFQSGFDPAFSKYSPGLVLLGRTIEYAIENKFKYFDLMRGNEEYKLNWTNKNRILYRNVKAFSTKGKMLHKFYLGQKNLKRRIKNIVN